MLNRINNLELKTNSISSEAGVKVIHPAFAGIMLITNLIA